MTEIYIGNMFGKGKLFFRYGQMAAGKSLQLLATAHNFQEHDIPFIIIKSEIDNRDGEGVVHSRALGDRTCLSISCIDNIYEIICSQIDYNNALLQDNIKWILVDESQFLTEEQVEQLGAICDNLGISVICYGLRSDFKTKLFPGTKRLFEIADSIEEIKSSCYCNSKTIFNARVDTNGNIVTEGKQVEIGGDDRYTSMCRKCYFTKTNHPLYKNNNE